jgi:hypothetical protein
MQLISGGSRQNQEGDKNADTAEIYREPSFTPTLNPPHDSSCPRSQLKVALDVALPSRRLAINRVVKKPRGDIMKNHFAVHGLLPKERLDFHLGALLFYEKLRSARIIR